MSLRWTEDDYQRYQQRAAPTLEEVGKKYGLSKYGNKKIKTDEGTFDSKLELQRWHQLKLMESAGTISDLERQVPFELAPSMVIQGRKKPPLKYVADFVYKQGGEKIVEDAKGVLTDVYIVKRHLMAAFHGVHIKEIRKDKK